MITAINLGRSTAGREEPRFQALQVQKKPSPLCSLLLNYTKCEKKPSLWHSTCFSWGRHARYALNQNQLMEIDVHFWSYMLVCSYIYIVSGRFWQVHILQCASAAPHFSLSIFPLPRWPQSYIPWRRSFGPWPSWVWLCLGFHKRSAQLAVVVRAYKRSKRNSSSM